MPDLSWYAEDLVHSDDPAVLAQRVVEAEDLIRTFRGEILDPAKRRLGHMLAETHTPFVSVGDRIVEASWAGTKYEVRDEALCADLLDHARTAPRQLDPASGEVEDEAAVAVRLFRSVFQTNRPRTRAVDTAFGAKAIDRYRLRTERGHPFVSVRKPAVPQPLDEEE